MTTTEQYEAYKKLLPAMQSFYPTVINNESPLPLTKEAVGVIRRDPYMRFTEEEIEDFFNVWTSRREYTLAICKLQVLYNESGVKVCECPTEEIVIRARHLAKFSENLNMSNRSWKNRRNKIINKNKDSFKMDIMNDDSLWG